MRSNDLWRARAYTNTQRNENIGRLNERLTRSRNEGVVIHAILKVMLIADLKSIKINRAPQNLNEMVCASEYQQSKRVAFWRLTTTAHNSSCEIGHFRRWNCVSLWKKAVRRKFPVHRQCTWCLSARPWDARVFVVSSSFVQNWNTTY